MKLILLLSVLLAFSVSAETWTLYGKIVKVHDGDGAVTLLDANKDEHKIRMAGIDAPEIKHSNKWKTQPFAKKSRQNLVRLIAGKQMEAYCHKFDKYDREVCKLVIPGTATDINLQQVKDGFAWYYKKYASEQSDYDQSAYALAEMSAKNKRLGLWLDKNPIPPCLHRKPKDKDCMMPRIKKSR